MKLVDKDLIKKIKPFKVKDTVNGIISKIKGLRLNKKKLLSVLLKFVFILLNVYLNYSTIKELNASYKEIASTLSPSQKQNKVIDNLKMIADNFLKSEKLPMVMFIYKLTLLIDTVIKIFKETFDEDEVDNSILFKKNIDVVVSISLEAVISTVVEHMTKKKSR